MTQEDKEFLLKDLCARLPYGVKCKSKYFINDTLSGIIIDGEETMFNFSVNDKGFITQLYSSEFKPYLFPLSSITEEQYREWLDTSDTVDWLNKNHFDHHNLIPKGLAIDATGLNIH